MSSKLEDFIPSIKPFFVYMCQANLWHNSLEQPFLHVYVIC